MTYPTRQEAIDAIKEAIATMKSQLLEEAETAIVNDDIVKTYERIKMIHDGIERMEYLLVRIYAYDNDYQMHFLNRPPDHTDN